MATRKHDPTPHGTSRVSEALGRLLLRIPRSDEDLAGDPAARARALRRVASRKAAAISAGLSLPPGPMGVMTVLPDLVAIWKLQSRLVADIAGAYGKTGSLTRESMLYCLFRHGSAALLRDVVVRTGERFVVRPAALRVMQDLLARIGVRVTERVIGRTVARWVPVLGALGVGAYALYDTKKVGDNAIEFFSSEIRLDPGEGPGSPRPGEPIRGARAS